MSMDATLRPDRELSAWLDAARGFPAVDVYVGTDLADPPYPFYLEYGTSRMAARPSGRMAFEETKDGAVREAGRALGDQFRRERFDRYAVEVAGLVGGQVIRDRWAEHVPVRTGTYRRSVQVEVEEHR